MIYLAGFIVMTLAATTDFKPKKLFKWKQKK